MIAQPPRPDASPATPGKHRFRLPEVTERKDNPAPRGPGDDATRKQVELSLRRRAARMANEPDAGR